MKIWLYLINKIIELFANNNSFFKLLNSSRNDCNHFVRSVVESNWTYYQMLWSNGLWISHIALKSVRVPCRAHYDSWQREQWAWLSATQFDSLWRKLDSCKLCVCRGIWWFYKLKQILGSVEDWYQRLCSRLFYALLRRSFWSRWKQIRQCIERTRRRDRNHCWYWLQWTMHPLWRRLGWRWMDELHWSKKSSLG